MNDKTNDFEWRVLGYLHCLSACGLPMANKGLDGWSANRHVSLPASNHYRGSSAVSLYCSGTATTPYCHGSGCSRRSVPGSPGLLRH